MKLTIASAILAQSLRTVNTAEIYGSSQVLSYPSFLHHVLHMERLTVVGSKRNAKSRQAFRQGTSSSSGISSLSDVSLDTVVNGILKNIQRIQHHVECDPDPGPVNGEVDVGILTCGVGRYCAESTESSIGGFCVMVGTTNQNDEPQYRGRMLQDNSFLNSLQYACDYAYLIGYECSCDLDADAYAGTAVCSSPTVCTTYPSACNVNSTDCRSDSYSVNIQSPGVWETELCIEYTAPYQLKTCYSSVSIDYGNDVLPNCSITFDGTLCDSCDAYATSNSTDKSQICQVFDCSNIDAGMTGNTCEFPVSSMALFLDTYGCPPCDICGKNGTMMSPATNVRILNNTYQCGYIEDISGMGFFTEASCQYFSAAVDTPCQCERGENYTSVPTDYPFSDWLMPTEEPTSSDTNATTAPTDTPSTGPTIETNSELDPLFGICNPCGPDREMTKMDGIVSIPMQGMFTCQELIIMGRVAEQDEDWCVIVRPFVQMPCGCHSTVPTVAPFGTLPPSQLQTIASSSRTTYITQSVCWVCILGELALSLFI